MNRREKLKPGSQTSSDHPKLMRMKFGSFGMTADNQKRFQLEQKPYIQTMTVMAASLDNIAVDSSHLYQEKK